MTTAPMGPRDVARATGVSTDTLDVRWGRKSYSAKRSVAERIRRTVHRVGSARVPDHVIVLSAAGLRRLLKDYVEDLTPHRARICRSKGTHPCRVRSHPRPQAV